MALVYEQFTKLKEANDLKLNTSNFDLNNLDERLNYHGRALSKRYLQEDGHLFVTGNIALKNSYGYLSGHHIFNLIL